MVKLDNYQYLKDYDIHEFTFYDETDEQIEVMIKKGEITIKCDEVDLKDLKEVIEIVENKKVEIEL